MDLVSINPGLVLGPILSSDCEHVGRTGREDPRSRTSATIPDVYDAMVDVRDVLAAADVAALRVPEAGRRRFICAIENDSMREVARILADHFDGASRCATGKPPGILLRAVALWDGTGELALNDLGVQQDVEHTQTVMCWIGDLTTDAR